MQRLPRLTYCNRAVAAVEFALILPVLLILLIGVAEITRYVLFNQKIDKTVNGLADLTTRNETLSQNTLDSYVQVARELMKPYAVDGSVTIIFTSIANVSTPINDCPGGGVACITWQYAALGSVGSSRLGGEGEAPVFPGNYQFFTPEQNIIAVEMFYHYTPIFSFTGTLFNMLDERDVYKVALYKPRLGSLASINL